jgi:hypothetical protein
MPPIGGLKPGAYPPGIILGLIPGGPVGLKPIPGAYIPKLGRGNIPPGPPTGGL